MKELNTADPKAHVKNIRPELSALAAHLRRDVGKVEDPRARALFETSAEVILGIDTAFAHYLEGREEAWK